MSSPDKVRVVFVTTVFEGVETGPATYAQYLWRAFQDDDGLEFHVVAPQFEQKHARLHAAGNGQGSLSLYRRVQDTAARLVRSWGGRCVVHGNSTHSMARLVGLPSPMVVQVNDYETARFPQEPLQLLREHGPRRLAAGAWRYWNERSVLARADRALCNSRYTAEFVRDAYGLAPGKVNVLHKAVDTSLFARPVRLPSDPLQGDTGGPRVLFVGTDWQRKGLEVLLDALRAVVDRRPPVQLVVIGPAPEDTSMRALIDARGLAGHVILAGRVGREQLPPHFWHADVFVLPSHREALGVAVLEALAAGLPVIATSTGGIPEIVRDGVDGLMVSPGDSNALARALVRLLDDSDERAALAQRGVARAGQFSSQAMIHSLRGHYADLAAGDYDVDRLPR